MDNQRTFCPGIVLGCLAFSFLCIPIEAQEVHYVTVEQPVSLRADAGADKLISQGERAMIGGNPTAIFGYGNYRYLWEPNYFIDDVTASNPMVNPEVTTIYQVSVFDALNCVSMDEVTVEVNASGIDDPGIPPKILIYPNPVDKYLNIDIYNYNGMVTIQVCNILGSVLTEQELFINHKLSVAFDMVNMRTGIYLIKVIQSKDLEVISFVKN